MCRIRMKLPRMMGNYVEEGGGMTKGRMQVPKGEVSCLLPTGIFGCSERDEQLCQ